MSGSKLTHWRARHVGFIFQMYNLIPVLTAFQNVELPLLLTKLSKSERRRHVETALSVVRSCGRMNHYPRQLSAGRSSASRSLAPSSPTLRSFSATKPTGDLDARARTK